MLYRPPEGDESVSVDIVDKWLVRATESLLSTWDPETNNFWRDSWGPDADTAEDEENTSRALGVGKGATSNNRSYQALVSTASLYHEYSIGESSAVRGEIVHSVQLMTRDYYTLDLDNLRRHGENRLNPFTDAQLLLSLCQALSPVTAHTCELNLTDHQTEKLTDNLTRLVAMVASQLGPDGVKVHDSARPHQFLTLHTVRALDAAQRTMAGLQLDSPGRRVGIEHRDDFPALTEKVREEIIQQLGLHLLPAPGFDSSSLVSCCALLSRFTGDSDSPLLRQAVDALDADQSERGTWTSAGVISFGRRRLVYVPSVELSLALSNLALLGLDVADTTIFDRSSAALAASLRLVQSSFRRHNDKAGWGNDRIRSGNEVESWTTAVVVEFLVSYRRALHLAGQEQILRKYRAIRRPLGFSNFWADLETSIPNEERQSVLRTGELPASRLADFSRLTDPTPLNSVVQGVRSDILEPTLRSVSQRPVSLVSYLLYGPPGTRKTSFVEAMAAALDWPLVTLTPPVFLRNGIEGFEAAADEIFEDLIRLERVVVLFDECEEFFRWRSPGTAIESRTVGAFITSGMLPRLQRLRDTRWIVFVINTNVEAFELDDAVTRRGRLDKVARVGHPSLDAQLRYLRRWESREGNKLTDEHLAWFTQHLHEVDTEVRPVRERLEDERQLVQRENPDRGEDYHNRMKELHRDEAKSLKKVVTFSMLDNLAGRCVGEGVESAIADVGSLGNNLQQEFDRFGPDSWIHETPTG